MSLKTTKKKVPVSRAVTKSIDLKHYGLEPTDITGMCLTDVYNWYNYMHEQDQAREWLLEYMKKSTDFVKGDLEAVKRLPKYDIPTTVGWIARILMNGNKLENMNYFNTRTAELIARGRMIKEEKETTDKPTVNVHERAAAKIDLLITDIEEQIDLDESFSVYEFLKAREATVQAANAIRDRYAPILEEVLLDDPQVKESFGKKLKSQQKFWQTFIDDCDRYAGNKKATKVRKPRAKKQKSAVEVIKNLKFQKEYLPLKIVSVNPADIIGAQQLWVYNTKYKKLSRYDALGPAGISVKGTTLTGFDTEKSVTKILRKPDVVIANVLSAGKIALRKIMSDLKTSETEATGRINSDTILLRVIK